MNRLGFAIGFATAWVVCLAASWAVVVLAVWAAWSVIS